MKKIVGFGEAMVRYAPANTTAASKNVQNFIRSVGGDELNVMVALNKYGYNSEWVTVLPTGPLGDYVADSATDNNVRLDNSIRTEGQMGNFTVIPELKRVFYDRNLSAFANLQSSNFDWNVILKDCNWVHATGITPMLGGSPLQAWKDHLDACLSLQIPFSIDFNYRPQLGSIESLWSFLEPYILQPGCKFLVLAQSNLEPIAQILRIDSSGTPEEVLVRIGSALATPVTCCFKTRDEAGVQTRWSVWTDGKEVVSTESRPVQHVPKDECGGGSAWAAGMIHAALEGNGLPIESALHRADVSAALCQESQGDHFLTNDYVLRSFERVPGSVSIPNQDIHTSNTEQLLESRMKRLEEAKVIGILRAKNADAAIARGKELASWGCRALEVTVDSKDWQRILVELKDSIGSICMLGVGTVYRPEEIEEAAKLGAEFALSPVNPPLFTNACKRAGVVPVPAVTTPNEMESAMNEGAKIIKLFPAQNWTPKALQDVKNIGNFKSVHIVPSGGITPENARSWLESGAFGVGLGSQLVGPDVSGKSKELTDAWRIHGPERASILFNNWTASSTPGFNQRDAAWEQIQQGKVEMRDGSLMPIVGFGLYQLPPEETIECTRNALKSGYRHFDSASFYRNEVEVGSAIKESGVARKDLYIASKVWNDMQGFDTTLQSAEQSLRELDCDYFDTFYVHWPVPGAHIETYKAVEQLYKQGITRSISISNYTIPDFEELLPHIEIMPVCNQIEVNPFVFRKATLDYFSSYDIQMVAYKPLGRGKYLQHPLVVGLAEKYETSPAQLLIKWCLQHKLVVLPRSSNAGRIQQNFELDGFTIAKGDMDRLNELTSAENLNEWYKHYKFRIDCDSRLPKTNCV